MESMKQAVEPIALKSGIKADDVTAGAAEWSVKSESVFSDRHAPPSELSMLVQPGKAGSQHFVDAESEEPPASAEHDGIGSASTLIPFIRRARAFADNPVTRAAALGSFFVANPINCYWQYMQKQGVHNSLIDSTGDFGWAMCGVSLVSWILRGVPYNREIGFAAVSLWAVLGETVLPQCFPGSPNAWDIPAAIFGASLCYIIAPEGIQSFFRTFESIMSWLWDKIDVS